MNNAETAPPLCSVQAEIIIENVAWNLCEFNLQEQAYVAILTTMQQLGFIYGQFEVAILLTDDAKMRELNHNFRNIDKPTNVLSFPAQEFCVEPDIIKDNQHIFLGDIAISYDRIAAESLEQNKSFQAHYVHMIVHSMLHLLGYDHENEEDANVMESLEIQMLNKLNINNPYIIN